MRKKSKKKKTKKKKQSKLKKALVSCKGKRGDKWNKCLRKHGIKR